MTEFIALLRGINVGGRTLKMETLRACLGELGLANVQTYVQSGNAVFSARGAQRALSGKIEAEIARELGHSVAVILRTSAELGRVIAANPFLRERGMDESKLHVTFLCEPPAKDALAKLAAIDAGADQWRASDREIYLYCPNGYGRTKLSNNAIERALKATATTRNWNSVRNLYAMASAR